MLRWPDRTWWRRLSRQKRVYVGIILLLAVISVFVLMVPNDNQSSTDAGVVSQLPNEPASDSNPTTENLVLVAPTPSPIPPTHNPPFLFGVGTELDQALNHRITKEAPVRLLTSWYNGPKDLGFMNGWRSTTVPEAYAAGYALHLIIYSNDPEQNLTTPYGPACGRPYPLSAEFLSDMQQLAQNFAGGKLYVSMFTELQTYPCSDNSWAGGENYYRTLKDQYLTAMHIFHQFAPGSQVSLSWGGWQTEWDDVGQGGGRSLFGHFADVMNASDFQSFQTMANTSNLVIVTDMTKALHPYSGGVMVAHYKPDNANQSTFNADLKNIFTPTSMATLQQHGLFAFSFMDTVNMNDSEITYQSVKNIIKNYAR